MQRTSVARALAHSGRTASRCRVPVLALLLTPTILMAQRVAIPLDSARWDLQGRAQVREYLGRTCLALDGGEATLRDFTLRDGIIDVDVATPAARGFFGLLFRADSLNAEFVYLRQHKSGAPDAMQYTPVLNTGLNWQLYSGPGFTGAVDIPRDTWFHLRLVIAGAQARLYVGDTLNPALVMPDLKSGVPSGSVGLADLIGMACYTNLTIERTPDVAWERHLPPMPAGTLVHWQISPSLDALQRDVERPLSATERAAMAWQDVDAEPPGIVAINRYRSSPHPRVTFQSDFSTRLNPQPGARVVYARTHIRAGRAERRKLFIGYSDEVVVFLNGRVLYRGRSAQSFRDPAFLGIMDAENDAVWLPLRAGDNELVLAVTEFGGGWGFVSRLGGAAR